ncbi:efflux RND transporter periplasmic adaptor subunit [Sodalis sp. RH20]|uniref:efflux RND transporter periplasmic adaptor subunit n=1 Tax=unclassified Sodalis (in: enterobacteria) TaxID=2636512 RepID=UPI0039B63B4B
MNRIMIRAGLIASALGLLTIGIGGGYWWAQRHADAHAEVSQPAVPAPQERQVLYWYDPMVPDQHFDQPGKSPFMDMQLVPRYAEQAATAGVRIDPGVQQNVGIRTAVVEVSQLTDPLRATATLTWDLRRESVVSARVDAIITQLHVKAPFESVRRGQPLATVLAPAWSSAIAEAQTLEEADSAAAKSLHTAAMQRLRLLGLSDTRLGRDGSVVLLAPSDGVVREVLVREGQAVAADMPLFRVNGTATVWLEAAIPQASVGGIGPGTKVEATLSAMPGRRFAGEVEALLPQIEPTSRTQWARIVLNNPDGRLVPGMFAELTLQSAGAEQVPLIPAAALIATGDDSRVIVMRSDGGFEPVRVRTGRSGGGRIEILEGLQGGEHIVTSGQFLIDSEASLSGALQRLGAPTPAASAPPDATENRP